MEGQKDAANKLLHIMYFTLIISVMNATIFNVVLTSIREEFRLTASQVSWMTTGYGIMYAIGSVTYGKLADRYRLKDLLTFGFILMVTGSLLGLSAQYYGVMVAGRMMQAAGGAVIPAVSMIIPAKYFPPENRGRAIGTMVSGLALGTAISPIAASLVTGMLHWRMLFCFSLFILLVLPVFRKYLQEEPERTGSKLDWIGGFLLAGTIALILLAITYSSWLFFGAGFVFFALFILRIRSAEEPFVQPALFHNRRYVLGVGIALLAASLSSGMPFIMPQLLTNISHVTPAFIGFVMFPGAMASALLGRTGGKLADERGSGFLFYLAAAPLLVSFGILSVFPGMPPAYIWIFLILASTGQTFIQVATSNSVSLTLSQEHVGIGMGFLTMMTFIIGAVSTSLIGKVLDWGAPVQLNPLLFHEQAMSYSNAFSLLFTVLVVVVALYSILVGARKTIGSSISSTQK